MSSKERTIVIGAGHGGSQCAISLRAANYSGDIVLIDDDVADLPYHKPPLSKKYLLDSEQKEVLLRPLSAYEKANVERLDDTVSKIDTDDASVSLLSGRKLSYTHLVIATGATNRSIPVLQGMKNVHSVRTLQDTQKLRDQVFSTDQIDILGGGFIGLEVAACLAGMGKSVRVLEAADRVLSRVVSPVISERVQASLEQIGVTVITGKMAVEFVTEDDVLKSITLDTGESINSSLLIVGIGALPNEELASSAGISCDNGIIVDETLRTSMDKVYALGDCARYPHWQTENLQRLESVQNAVDQAKQIALQIAENNTQHYRTVPWFWSDIGAQKLQIAGIYQGDTEEVLREEDGKLALYHLQNNRVVSVETINNAKDHMLSRKLIGTDIAVSREDILAGTEALKALLG